MKMPMVLLLAGGKSSRFWPLPHKMTMTYVGQTLLEYQIDLLKRVGFADIVVVVNSEIKQRFSGEKITFVTQVGHGQGAAILSAQSHVGSKPILVINADDIVAPELFSSLLQKITNKNLLVGYKTEEYFPGGYFELKDKQVVKIHEKPGAGKEPSPYTRLVCDYFTNAKLLYSYLQKTCAHDPISAYEEALSQMMQDKIAFEMMEYRDTWIPLKYPWQALSAMEYFLQQIKTSKIASSAKIHKTATVTGSVIIEDNVRVMEYAKLVGPLYIGAGTIIGNHTLIRSSMIGENSVIGFGSDVTRSYIGNNSWFHSNYVGDSVISDNVGMGAGATLANLRLDEGEVFSKIKNEKIGSQKDKLGAIIGEGVRIGVGAQLMPGIKVGKNSVVGPGVLLNADLEDNTVCYVKQSHTITSYTPSFSPNRDKFRKKI